MGSAPSPPRSSRCACCFCYAASSYGGTVVLRTAWSLRATAAIRPWSSELPEAQLVARGSCPLASKRRRRPADSRLIFLVDWRIILRIYIKRKKQKTKTKNKGNNTAADTATHFVQLSCPLFSQPARVVVSIGTQWGGREFVTYFGDGRQGREGRLLHGRWSSVWRYRKARACVESSGTTTTTKNCCCFA